MDSLITAICSFIVCYIIGHLNLRVPSKETVDYALIGILVLMIIDLVHGIFFKKERPKNDFQLYKYGYSGFCTVYFYIFLSILNIHSLTSIMMVVGTLSLLIWIIIHDFRDTKKIKEGINGK
jgi:hypothetical protein